MRNALLTVGFIVTLTSSAHARLGETPDQLVARYGQPLNEADQKADGAKIPLASVTFQKGGYQIDVTITDGVSTQEVFKKINGQSMTVSEARVLLAANAQGREWGPQQKGDNEIVWRRDDNALAKLPSDGSMIIRSHELANAEATAKKLEQRPSLEGF
jgi:hypothetical protein